MERYHYNFGLLFFTIILLGLSSFLLCIAAEFKKSKKRDIKLDGKLCSLPGNVAFGLGMGALICLFIAQIIGNVIVCRRILKRPLEQSCMVNKPPMTTLFLLLSWISFGIAVVLIGGASSMNRSQPVGKGWLDGECYIVKDGVYVGSGILALMAAGSNLGSAITTMRKRQVEEDKKVHSQLE